MRNLAIAVCVATACAATLSTPSVRAQSTASAAAPVPAALVKPGLWEITSHNETPGSDTSTSIISRLCFSAAAAADVRQILPPQHDFGLQCQNRDPQAKGLDVTWQITCTGKSGSVTGTGTLNLAGGGYQGRATLDRAAPGSKPSKIVQSISGKWLEDCK